MTTLTEKPKVTAIAPWFGSKRTMAPRIVRELGDHVSYWEPFCGSMAVLFAKRPTCHEHVSDLHDDLINLAWVLQDRSKAEQLYDFCRRTLFHESLFRQSERAIRNEPFRAGWGPNTRRAYHFMVCSWMGRNGVAGTARINQTFAMRYTPGGGHGGVRWQSVAESIPAWHERLRRVSIVRCDAFQLLEKIEDVAGTAIYVDPPYLVEGRQYVYSFDTAQHIRLAKLLARFRQARVVVSYYRHRWLEWLYPRYLPAGWTHIDATTDKKLHVQNRRGATRTDAPEMLLVNGPSRAQAGGQTRKLF